MADAHPPLRTYGRTKARTLKPRQAGLVETLLPHVAVPAKGEIDIAKLFEGHASSPLGGRVGREGDGDVAQAAMSRLTVAPPHPYPSPTGEGTQTPTPLILEIGFGGGEHLVAQAQAHPGARFIGVEPFLNGVASCLRHIEASNVQNVRLHMGDARDVLARLPDSSLDLVYILFPDPWPKTRHWKRRLIQPDFIGELARVLKRGGEVRFATDWAHFAAWTLELFMRPDRASSDALLPGAAESASEDARTGRFTWLAECAQDWREPWEGHVTTRYEQKRLGDCAPIWLRFEANHED